MISHLEYNHCSEYFKVKAEGIPGQQHAKPVSSDQPPISAFVSHYQQVQSDGRVSTNQ